MLRASRPSKTGWPFDLDDWIIMSVNPASVTNPPAQFPEDFVFGGATAAYQVEGETRTHGKGKVA